VVSSNLIIRPGTFGITGNFDLGGAVEEIAIVGNIVIDANELGVSPNTGINLASGAGNPLTMRNVVVANNIVRDTRGTKRTDNGLRINLTDLTLSHILIEGNVFEDVVLSSLQLTGGTTISELILGHNKFKKGQLYGTAALGSGTVTVDAVGLPDALAMRAEVCRVAGAGTARGHLEALYDTANSQLIITAQTNAAVTEMNDTSTVLWRILGTADAFA
jgi:hypothetical protein